MTYPLIELKSVPIEIEMKITDAKLEYKRGTVDMQVSRNEGGLQIKSSPIRLNLDTFEARNSVMPTVATQIQRSAEAGQQAAYSATATYARQGQLLLQAREEEGTNAGTMSGLKQYVQYFAEHAKNLYENLTKEGE